MNTNKELYYAKDIDPAGWLFGVISVSELGEITSSTTKAKWLKKTKEEWWNTKGIKDSSFDIDCILVPVEETRCPISGMTEEQSKAISDAMLKMLEERGWSIPMTFVEA